MSVCTSEIAVTGAEYLAAMTVRASDRRARAAFQSLAMDVAGPAATVFDFGAGPGVDARCYAEHGRRVVAYDIDPGMAAFFAEYCQDLIRDERVELHTGSYQDFLARGAFCQQRVNLVTANFAPLSLITDLRELFACFAWMTRPDGAVLASVLNPYFLGDLRYGWWWRNAYRLLRDGHYSLPGAQGNIVRRGLDDFSRQCAPHFVLQRVFAAPSAVSLSTRGYAAPTGRGLACLRLTACRFMFLLFRKPVRRSASHADGLLV
ncbi:class I SAM-dependent methyltransferase [Steroidobacter cummioxidans]|uniref:class I SAM-dependent methyltransferase n=1 Tax=Steroidobacter cummioxidans TaxID=1803913 RepID=UPI000E30DF40|nr:class I SAM-dependent methyltransferase [Steroidobacter cummioxidans]